MAATGQEEPDDKNEESQAARLGDKDGLGLPGRCRPDRAVAHQREGRMPPQQTRETRASHRAGKLGEHVGRDAPTRECASISHRTIVTAMNRRTVVSANSSAARASGIRE
jgi:hypothetical protein